MVTETWQSGGGIAIPGAVGIEEIPKGGERAEESRGKLDHKYTGHKRSNVSTKLGIYNFMWSGKSVRLILGEKRGGSRLETR